MTAVGLDIAAQGGDFEGMGSGDGGDGTMVHAGLDHLDILGDQARQHFAGRHGHGDVDIRHACAQQRVPHGTADKARFAQRRHNLNSFRRGHPAML